MERGMCCWRGMVRYLRDEAGQKTEAVKVDARPVCINFGT
jgi:hypothetical protein